MIVAQVKRALVERRRQLGLTQAQVAERMGISTSVYQKIELGTRGTVKLDTLERIETALECRLEVTLQERGNGDGGKARDRGGSLV